MSGLEPAAQLEGLDLRARAVDHLVPRAARGVNRRIELDEEGTGAAACQRLRLDVAEHAIGELESGSRAIVPEDVAASELMAPGDRPIEIVKDGRVIEALLAKPA